MDRCCQLPEFVPGAPSGGTGDAAQPCTEPAPAACPSAQQPGQPSQPEEQPHPEAQQQPQASSDPPAGRGGEGEGERHSEEGEEGVPADPELAQFALGVLQRVQPGADLTAGSIKMLALLLDEVTERVLCEAQRISGAQAAGGGGGGAPGGRGAPQPPTLTTLDIHKALKRVLPGEPGDRLRPCLPQAVKQAWHLDKQSLKGVKKQKLMGGEAAAAAVGGQENYAATAAAGAGLGEQGAHAAADT